MPEQEIPTLELSQAVPNAKDFNAKVATELADQGREMQTTHIETESLDTHDALNELRTKITKEKADAVAKKEADEEGDVIVPAKETKPTKEVASEKTKDAPASEAPDATITPVKPDVAPAAVPDKPDDIFAGISLPPNVKPKSTEAWAALKAKALEEISARDAKLAETEKKLAELEAQAKQPVDESILKELEDHRTFRSKLDVEADPKFKAYDKEIADNHAFVYSQLLKTGKITQENIDTIKKHGGPRKVHLEKVFELINDPHVQRVIQSKIADEEMLHFRKEQAIKETKENVAGYLKEREEDFSKAVSGHNDATKKEFSTLVSKMDWTKPKTAPKDADAAAKKEVEEHNKFVESTKKDLEAALVDDSPAMRAILLAGMGQLLQLQRTHKSVTTKLTATEKELASAVEKLEKIKGASRSRLPESSAPVGVKVPEKAKDDFSTPTVDALENIRKQIQRERSEKVNA